MIDYSSSDTEGSMYSSNAIFDDPFAKGSRAAQEITYIYEGWTRVIAELGIEIRSSNETLSFLDEHTDFHEVQMIYGITAGAIENSATEIGSKLMMLKERMSILQTSTMQVIDHLDSGSFEGQNPLLELRDFFLSFQETLRNTSDDLSYFRESNVILSNRIENQEMHLACEKMIVVIDNILELQNNFLGVCATLSSIIESNITS